MRTVFANIISAVASVGITALAVAASAPAVATSIDTAPSATVRLAGHDHAVGDARRTLDEMSAAVPVASR